LSKWYKEDLAYIHDVGYRDYCLKSTPGILKILAQNNIREGLIVELGCGSGLLAKELTEANYQVLGIDISESLIQIARTRVPNAQFRIESLFKTNIPTCRAVISISECFNYLFDRDNNLQTLIQLFQNIYKALVPQGVLIFDIAEPGQLASDQPTKIFNEGDDWIVLVEKYENQEKEILTRRIISLRLVGEHYRRDDEIHDQQLYKAVDIVRELEKIGFQVQVSHGYGEYQLPKAHAAFIATKV